MGNMAKSQRPECEVCVKVRGDGADRLEGAELGAQIAESAGRRADSVAEEDGEGMKVEGDSSGFEGLSRGLGVYRSQIRNV